MRTCEQGAPGLATRGRQARRQAQAQEAGEQQQDEAPQAPPSSCFWCHRFDRLWDAASPLSAAAARKLDLGDHTRQQVDPRSSQRQGGGAAYVRVVPRPLDHSTRSVRPSDSRRTGWAADWRTGSRVERAKRPGPLAC